jgi:centromere protein S
MRPSARHVFPSTLLHIIQHFRTNAPQRLKASLWFSIGKIVDEESLRLNSNATPQFIGALTEMVWAQIGRPSYPLSVSFQGLSNTSQLENVAIDLESFARHAGRSTISPEDVLLITRRNDALHGMIQDFVQKEQASKTRRVGAGAGAGKKSVGRPRK